MEASLSVIPSCIFLHKLLWIGKAWNDIKEVNATSLHIVLPLCFIPFKAHSLLYVQIVCTVKSFNNLERALCKERTCHATGDKATAVGGFVAILI